MLISKKSKIYICVFFAIALVINLIDLSPYIKFPFHLIEAPGWGILMMYWGVAVYLRVSDRRIRGLLIRVMLCFMFLFFLQILKYQLLKGFEHASRLCWYAYYTPMIMASLYSLLISRSLYSNKLSNDKTDHALTAAALILVAFSLSNDLHQQIWGFKPGRQGLPTEPSWL
ncbi:MAG: hypothetical protein K5686_10155 [Lachnospiraceae bacterium]|nr:hypothetical protein [Lachnospiraceae bacterium]